MRHAVAELVEALCYRPGGCGFDLEFFTMAPVVDSTSNRKEYQEYFLGGRGVNLARALG